MFQGIISKVKEVLNKLFNKSTIESKANVEIAVSNEMQNAIDRWTSIYENKAPWVDKKTVFSMNLGAGIANEFAKLVTIEFKSEILNNPFLNEEYQAVIENIRNYTEFAAAKGGLVFKPYLSNNHIEVDLVQADMFYPTTFNSRGDILGAIFIETKTIGDTIYSRLEVHNMTTIKENGKDISCTEIKNIAFKKKNYNQLALSRENTLGDEISLTEVEDWANLEPSTTIKNIDKPLFAYFKMPLANNIDSSSPLGVSVFAPVADDILKKADEQYSRIDWEYKGSELAIDVSKEMIRPNYDKNNNYIDDGMPVGKERLYRKLDIDPVADKTSSWNVFSPAIRDISLYNGLQHQLRTIEFMVGLAYGTISDPQNTDKTATEIESSKQRSWQTVSDIQKAQKKSLKHLGYAMSVWGQIGKLPVKPLNIEKDMTFDYDDSIIRNKNDDLASMQVDVASGILRAEIYLAKKYGVSEDVAKTMMPDTSTIINPSPFDTTA